MNLKPYKFLLGYTQYTFTFNDMKLFEIYTLLTSNMQGI